MRLLRRFCDPLVLAIALPILCLSLALTAAQAFADTGGSPPLDPSLIELAFKGIAERNWFLVAGPVLAVLVYFARPVLGWLWPSLETSDRWGVAITALLAGAGALAHAWIADEPVIDATTLLGAIKVFVMAVASYVVTKRVVAPKTPPAPPSSGAGGIAIRNAGAIGLVSLVLATSLFAGVGCRAGRRAVQHAGSAAANVIDCMTPDASDAIGAFGPALAAVVRAATSPDGHVDWTPIGDAAKGLKTPAKQCVLAAAVKEALAITRQLAGAPQSSPATIDRASLLAGWEAQRAAWGGAKYQLPGGAL